MNEYRVLRLNPDTPRESIRELRADIETMKAQGRPTTMREVLLAKMVGANE